MYLRYLCCLVVFVFLRDFSITCPVCPVMGLNVAVQNGRVRVSVSVRVRDRL